MSLPSFMFRAIQAAANAPGSSSATATKGFMSIAKKKVPMPSIVSGVK